MQTNHAGDAMKQLFLTRKFLQLFAMFLVATSAYSAWASPLFSFKNTVLQASEISGVAKKPKKEKNAKSKKAGGVTFLEGSAESRSERDRRLMRECRGRANSGACEGYTRP
jgi:hypothetical protein